MIMRMLLSIIGIVLGTTINAATWTFHAWPDNYTDVTLGETFNGSPWHYADSIFDYNWDVAFPESADSGIYTLAGATIVPQALTLSVTVPDDWWMTSFYVAEGWPGYNGSWSGVQRPDLTAGEYWVDFASDGSYRISTTQPTDWGKWAWDGSINPSWVEPAVPLTHGRRLALGHSK